MIKKKCKDRSN